MYVDFSFLEYCRSGGEGRVIEERDWEACGGREKGMRDGAAHRNVGGRRNKPRATRPGRDWTGFRLRHKNPYCVSNHLALLGVGVAFGWMDGGGRCEQSRCARDEMHSANIALCPFILSLSLRRLALCCVVSLLCIFILQAERRRGRLQFLTCFPVRLSFCPCV